MNVEEFRSYCLSLGNVSESFPFDNKTLVFKVNEKIFALTNIDEFLFFNVKCNPENAISLREEYIGVKPGYHMNKKHWNSITTLENIETKNLKKWIKDSFNLVAKIN